MNRTTEQRVAAARARMAELKDKFLERSRIEHESMRAAFTRLKAGDAAALGTILHLAHRMSGTGATLGLGALSEKAQRIEKLTDAQAPGVVPDPAALAQLQAAMETLAAEIG